MLSDFLVDLQKYTGINNYLIYLINNQQQLYSLIYTLELIKLEILKNILKLA